MCTFDDLAPGEASSSGIRKLDLSSTIVTTWSQMPALAGTYEVSIFGVQRRHQKEVVECDIRRRHHLVPNACIWRWHSCGCLGTEECLQSLSIHCATTSLCTPAHERAGCEEAEQQQHALIKHLPSAGKFRDSAGGAPSKTWPTSAATSGSDKVSGGNQMGLQKANNGFAQRI